ncbi:MAG: MFS transporter [Actinomycetia bacterium]|nr:MFS transporter [Actinomycetes bacterium]
MSPRTAVEVVEPERLERWLAPRTDIVLEEVSEPGVFTLVEGPFRHYRRTIHHEPVIDPGGPDEGKVRVHQTLDFQLDTPLAGWLFLIPVRRLLSQPARSGRRPPWWHPPDRMDQRTAKVMARLALLSIIYGYLGVIISQTLTFAADSFDASDGDQGFVLAAVRIGGLISLWVAFSADRRGRRPLLALASIAGILITAIGAAAPSLLWLGVSQTVARGLATALNLVVGVAAAEEVPAGSRAWAASVLTLCAGLGAGMVLWVLPVADLDPDAWRIVYLIPLIALPLVMRAIQDLPESRRFERTSSRAPEQSESTRGRLARTYAAGRVFSGDRRLILLSSTAFLFSIFASPASQFLNEYLRDEQGFSAARIALYRLVTATPAGIGIMIGGRLADVRGRRSVGAVALFVGSMASLLIYWTSGPPLWAFSLLGTVVGAAAVPALGVYGEELFPTGRRASSKGIITLIAVMGSAIGVIATGQISDRVGSLAIPITFLAVAPVVVTAMIRFLYPETARLELEHINPEDQLPDDPR